MDDIASTPDNAPDSPTGALTLDQASRELSERRRRTDGENGSEGEAPAERGEPTTLREAAKQRAERRRAESPIASDEVYDHVEGRAPPIEIKVHENQLKQLRSQSPTIAARQEKEGAIDIRKAADALGKLRQTLPEQITREINEKEAAARAERGELAAAQEQPTAQPEMAPEAVAEHPAVKAERDRILTEARQVHGELARAGRVALATVLGDIEAHFGDIKSEADLQRVAATNLPRAQAYAATIGRLQAAGQMVQQVEGHQKAVDRDNFVRQAKVEDDRFYADKETGFTRGSPQEIELQNLAAEILPKVYGVDLRQMAELYNSHPAFRSAAAQGIIRDALRYRQAKANVAKPVSKPIPQVQQPGIARPAGAANAERIGALSRQLERATGSSAVRIAAQLLQAKRAGN